jgi:YidC/Oxa1 family membrane protein insertase
MDTRRVVLYAILALVIYSLWTAWQTDYPTVAPSHQSMQEPTVPVMSTTSEQLMPDMADDKKNIEHKDSSTQTVQVKTDVLDLLIDLKQGDIVQAQLLDYPESNTEKNKPFMLLQNNEGERYVADSSLFIVNEQRVQPVDVPFASDQTHYALTSDQNEMIVSLKGKTSEGLAVKKEFVFEKGSYLITVRYVLANEGDQIWKGYMNTQLLRSSPKEDTSSIFHVGSWTGAS